MSKFDVVLIVIGVVVVGACATDIWLITNGYPEPGSGFWSVVLGLSGGEIATFSIYRMVKQRVSAKLASGHKLVEADMEADKEEEKDGQASE